MHGGCSPADDARGNGYSPGGRLVSISGDTLYRYASEGFIPAFKLGNRWRFKRSLLDAWMVRMNGPKATSNVTVLPREKKPAGRAR